MPPASITLATLWLLSGSALGLLRFTAEFFRSSQNPMQILWFITITVLTLLNIGALVFYFLRKPQAHLYYYGSLALLFVAGMTFFVLVARSGQQAGAFTAQCATAALIFTISFLPYREQFARKRV